MTEHASRKNCLRKPSIRLNKKLAPVVNRLYSASGDSVTRIKFIEVEQILFILAQQIGCCIVVFDIAKSFYSIDLENCLPIPLQWV